MRPEMKGIFMRVLIIDGPYYTETVEVIENSKKEISLDKMFSLSALNNVLKRFFHSLWLVWRIDVTDCIPNLCGEYIYWDLLLGIIQPLGEDDVHLRSYKHCTKPLRAYRKGGWSITRDCALLNITKLTVYHVNHFFKITYLVHRSGFHVLYYLYLRFYDMINVTGTLELVPFNVPTV